MSTGWWCSTITRWARCGSDSVYAPSAYAGRFCPSTVRRHPTVDGHTVPTPADHRLALPLRDLRAFVWPRRVACPTRAARSRRPAGGSEGHLDGTPTALRRVARTRGAPRDGRGG